MPHLDRPLERRQRFGAVDGDRLAVFFDFLAAEAPHHAVPERVRVAVSVPERLADRYARRFLDFLSVGVELVERFHEVRFADLRPQVDPVMEGRRRVVPRHRAEHAVDPRVRDDRRVERAVFLLDLLDDVADVVAEIGKEPGQIVLHLDDVGTRPGLHERRGFGQHVLIGNELDVGAPAGIRLAPARQQLFELDVAFRVVVRVLHHRQRSAAVDVRCGDGGGRAEPGAGGSGGNSLDEARSFHEALLWLASDG